jgi:hypothetical protein
MEDVNNFLINYNGTRCKQDFFLIQVNVNTAFQLCKRCRKVKICINCKFFISKHEKFIMV